jgi:deazaflavin-dependent oxidoreductase (nitroreductase family)
MLEIVSWGEASARDAVRRFNKLVVNPVMMRLAGRRYWYASAIRHRGRRSGREYATPVVAEEVDGGFVIPLPYGTHVDWLRNVLAAGQAVLEIHGKTFTVLEPRVLPSDQALPLLPSARASWWRLTGIDAFLEVRTAPEPAPPERPAARKRPSTGTTRKRPSTGTTRKPVTRTARETTAARRRTGPDS